MGQRAMKTHVTVLGWIYILANATFLVLGITGFVFLTGLGVLSGDFEAVKVLGFIGGVGAVFFTLLALPGLAAGFGLLKFAGTVVSGWIRSSETCGNRVFRRIPAPRRPGHGL